MIERFVTRLEKKRVEVKEVGCGGLLLHLSLTIDDVETYFNSISKKDNW